MTSLIRKNRMTAAIVITAVIVCTATALFMTTVIAKDQSVGIRNPEAEKIIALDKMWSDKYATKDAQGMANLLAENTIQFPPDAPMIKGKEAVAAAWQGMLSTEGLELSWKADDAFVSASKDLAYSYGPATMKTPDGTIVEAKYVTIWIRENGEWKVAADIFNTNGPVAK